MSTYADVILPLPLENQYTYRIPADLEPLVVRGSRVIVHFGKKRFYTAIVVDVHDRQPQTDYEVKEIFSILDATPILRRPQLRFWEWIASYYICKLGDVYKAALPSGLKLESETTVTYNPDFEADAPLKPNEQAVLDAFGRNVLKQTVSDLEKKTGLRNIVPIIASLMGKGAVGVSEELKPGFVPKTQTYVRLHPDWATEDRMQEAFDAVKRAKKQEQLLVCFLDLTHALNPVLRQEVSKKELLEKSGQSAAILDGLLKRGILQSYEKEVSRLQARMCRLEEPHALTDEQQVAYGKIQDIFAEKEVCLLHGVTSSGKTEIYIHLIRQVLRSGRQVLYLLPEIAITTQITDRLVKIFGDQLLVYHSKFSDNERVEVWNKLLHGKGPMLVLGVRSSIFLPFSSLGLIIVDEEHETTYKQQDPAPRYHARNAAIILAQMHGGKVLLGSATPSIDSYFNAMTGKFGLVELPVRYGAASPPEMILANIRELKRRKQMQDTLFSPILVEKMRQALEAGQQVILFQNRRGFAPMIECKDCGWIPRCQHCDVSMTYHKFHQKLVCHYCGYTIRVPSECPECHSVNIRPLGFGTEKVEEEIASLFPAARTARMDLDTARTRTAYERIIGDFEKQKTDILIGTQMISKGLDFERVKLVGVMDADSLMGFPDFRAEERAYDMLMQVSGRSGRKGERGKVVIQVTDMQSRVYQLVRKENYREFYTQLSQEREMFNYPPFSRLIQVELRHVDEVVLRNAANELARLLRERLERRVCGPAEPDVSRVRKMYRIQILIKAEQGLSLSKLKAFLKQKSDELVKTPIGRGVRIYFDVDPL